MSDTMYFHFDNSPLTKALSNPNVYSVRFSCVLITDKVHPENGHCLTQLWDIKHKKINPKYTVVGSFTSIDTRKYECYFDADDLRELTGHANSTEDILLTSNLKRTSGLDGRQVAVVYVAFFNEQNDRLAIKGINGCPVPPCAVEYIKAGKEISTACLNKYNELRKIHGFKAL